MKKLFDERGFILLSVVFLTLITSFMAMMILNVNMKVYRQSSDMRFIAIYLAEEQFAMIESLAANGNLLSTSYNNLLQLETDDELMNKFDVRTTVSDSGSNLKNVSVTVKWVLEGNDFEINSEKVVHVSQ